MQDILLVKAKKRILPVTLISLLIIVASFAIVAFINLNGADEQINKITKDLVGNTYRSTYESSVSMVDDKLTFYENNKVRLDRNSKVYDMYGHDDKTSSTSKEIKYSVNISILGNATVVIIPSEASQWDPMSISYDKKGLACLGDRFVIQNRDVYGQITKQASLIGILWIVILIGGIVAVATAVIAYLRILHAINRGEKEHKKHIAEEERLRVLNEEIEKENNRKATIRAFWNEAVCAFGYEENKAILVQGKLMWVANRSLYQVESFEEYLMSYDRQKNTGAIIKKAPVHFVIPVEKIQYFAKEGDVQYTTRISGGGGGGYSITGAIVGGIIAGDAGAVIGSRKKINDVTSETETHDSRRTILRYYNGNSLEIMNFDGFAVYDFLLGNIPEKDLLTIQLQKSNISVENEGVSSVKEKLQALKSLQDDGLISDSDYEEKKNQLLEKL